MAHLTHVVSLTFSQDLSSLALMVYELWCFEDWEETKSVTERLTV